MIISIIVYPRRILRIEKALQFSVRQLDRHGDQAITEAS
jgi:hypothetical protein